MATINIEMEDKEIEEYVELKQGARIGQRNAETVMRIIEIESSILNKVLAECYYDGEE